MSDMRDMTERELTAFYDHGRCPFCAGKAFRGGPCGGMCQNIECAGCGARLNIIPSPEVCGYPTPHIGQVLREPTAKALPSPGTDSKELGHG